VALWIERIAAIMLGLVTVIIFISAIGRYLFNSPLPDAFDISRLTLAVAIVWGLASVAYRGSHIKVDLLAQIVRPKVRRWLDVVAWLVLLIFTAGLVWKIGERVMSQYPGGEATMDLRLPHWPFLGAIVLGLVAALIMTSIRIWRIWRHGEDLESYEKIDEEHLHE
jgi:TRAP-type C4-dicarboxylate transport system permease small subunit